MRRIGMLLLVLLLCGCAAPQIAPEEQGTVALTSAPVSESTPTPEPTPEPMPLPSLPPHGERVYLKDLAPPDPDIYETPFRGEALSRQEVENLRAEITELDQWAGLFGCLAGYGISLGNLGELTPEYEPGANPDSIAPCQFETIGDGFASLAISGWFAGDSVDCLLCFQQEGTLYRPHCALLDALHNNAFSPAVREAGGDTWLVEERRVNGGTGYAHREAVWYNLPERHMALEYTTHWQENYSAGARLPGEYEEAGGHVYLWLALDAEAEPPTPYEGDAFAMNIHETLSLRFDYYDDDWESEDGWVDNMERRFAHRLYYDPEARDFFFSTDEEIPCMFRFDFHALENETILLNFAALFREDLERFSADGLSYRADWARLLLSELDEGEEGDEG